MSRWEAWSNGSEHKKRRGYSSFLSENPQRMGNPAPNAGGPAARAAQMGLTSDGSGNYMDPKTGQKVATTVNNELVFIDNNRATGGAISDSSGGAELTQFAPSWMDPLTGMLTVPPARPESPEEISAVPDATPATAPKGYDAFMNKKKDQAYAMGAGGPEAVNMAGAAPEIGMNTGAMGFRTSPGLPSAMTQPVGEDYLPQDLAKRDINRPVAPLERVKNARAAAQASQPPVQAQPQIQKPETPEVEDKHPVLSATRSKILSAIQTMNTGKRERAGVGGLELSPDDLDKLENYIKNGPQNESIDLSDEDFEWAKGELDKSLGGARSKIKGYISRLSKKGSVPEDLQVNNRGERVLRSYLSNLGQSAIDGSPLPLSQSDLDHLIPLADGGEDDIENWRWLPRRFNNFKKDYEDQVLLERIQKQRDRDPLDDKLKKMQSELQNRIRSEWKTSYGERGWDHLNKADLMQLKGGPGMQKLKALANAAGIATTTSEGVKPGARSPNRSKSIEELRNDLIEGLDIPDVRDIETLDRSVFETLQSLEDRRVEVDSVNREKLAKAAAARKAKRADAMKGIKEEYLSAYTRERVEAFRRFRARFE